MSTDPLPVTARRFGATVVVRIEDLTFNAVLTPVEAIVLAGVLEEAARQAAGTPWTGHAGCRTKQLPGDPPPVRRGKAAKRKPTEVVT